MSSHVLPWRSSASERGEIQWSNIWKERTCGYFKWADEVHEIRDMQMRLLEKHTEIAELEMEKGFLEDKIKRLKKQKA
ncbi:Non-centrosomal microtubule array protein 1 [Bienertia sinuspersici]